MYLPMKLYVDDVPVDTDFFHIGGMYYVGADGAFRFIRSKNVIIECCDLQGTVIYWTLEDFIESELQGYPETDRQIALFGLFMPYFVVNVDLSTICYWNGKYDNMMTKNLSSLLYYLRRTDFEIHDSWLYMSSMYVVTMKVYFIGDERKFIGMVNKYKTIV